jgi:GNAT superfamily N-acetyltransferase
MPGPAMSPAFTLRPAEPADLPAVAGLIRGLADYEGLLGEVEATEERLRAAFFPGSGPPAAECVLAIAAGAAAGFAVFFPTFSTFLGLPGLYLEDLYVAPEHRGRGIGRALLLHVARLANRRGCGRLEWSVLAWNEPAIGFYESLGARRLEDWRTYRLAGADLARHA